MKVFGLRFLCISSLIPYDNAGEDDPEDDHIASEGTKTPSYYTTCTKASDNTREHPGSLSNFLQMIKDFFSRSKKSIQKGVLFSDFPPDLSS